MAESKQPAQQDACPCGSGKTYGACCGRQELCACGSGQAAGECCHAG
ncbi:MAG: SEC-C domain-containing protein [Actinomycetia bacterium]|nr:SEC-C domain-containing protein [Actinomycetes bacterium]